MNVQLPDIKIRYIRTKNKTRKLVTYSSDDCELRVRHKRINDFIEARFIPSIFSKGYVKIDLYITMPLRTYTMIILSCLISRTFFRIFVTNSLLTSYSMK